MDKQSVISSLQKEMQQSPWDIKAELQLLLALSNGLSADEFMVCCNRFFKREYSKDVFSSVIKEDSKKLELLELQLSRTGLYDQLPEGLFFQISQKESRQHSVNDSALNYKKNKSKEEEIRRFFLPFDNAFFEQRLRLEQEESALLEGLRSGIMNDYFISFWNLPASIPKMFMVPFILLLPYANKIAGDLKLTAQCLGYLLKEKVNLVQRNAGTSSAAGIDFPGLGEGQLGFSMVCGTEFVEDNPVIEIEIGPIKNSQVKDYLEGGKREALMETFIRFFIPAGLDVITSVKLPHEKQDMMLEKGAEPVLGYSTVLG